jgi:hypothetical protein
MMLMMKWMGAALVPVFVLSTLIQSALPLAHHLDSSTTQHLHCQKNPSSAQLKTSSTPDHHPDSCTICRILASLQPGTVQGVPTLGVPIPTVNLARVVSPLVVASDLEITSGSPRAPPHLSKSIQG